MERVFVAFSFNSKDRAIVADVEVVLRSFGIVSDGGEVLGGEDLDKAIQEKIKKSDGLIAVLTRRDDPDSPPYSQWVLTELTAAKVLKKLAIAFVEKGLKLPGGMFSQDERIEYDPKDPLPAFLKLVRTVGEWKRASGRQIKVILLPDELAQLVRSNRDDAQCSYRFIRNGEPECDWQEARISPEIGATLAYLRGAKDDQLIEVRVKVKGEQWTSVCSQQWTHVRLEKVGSP